MLSYAFLPSSPFLTTCSSHQSSPGTTGKSLRTLHALASLSGKADYSTEPVLLYKQERNYMHKSTVFFTGLLQVCIRPRVREFQEFESAQLSLNPYGE